MEFQLDHRRLSNLLCALIDDNNAIVDQDDLRKAAQIAFDDLEKFACLEMTQVTQQRPTKKVKGLFSRFKGSGESLSIDHCKVLELPSELSINMMDPVMDARTINVYRKDEIDNNAFRKITYICQYSSDITDDR